MYSTFLPWLLALCLLLVACQRGTPEQRLRQRLAGMQEAAEQKRIGDFMEHVSADFTGGQGMDRVALHHLLRLHTLGNADIGATTGPLEVEVQGDNATVDFQVLLTGGQRRFLPEQVRPYRIHSAWRLEQGEWRVHYARWEDRGR